MKNLSRNGKILAGAALVLCLVIVVALCHMVFAIHSGLTPSGPAAAEDLSAYDVIFQGQTTILDEEYDIVLKGNDGKFSVDANSIQNVVEGDYTFTEGQGWTFAFQDSMGTNVRSQYSAQDKAHSFIYNIDLGSRGAGYIRLSKEDESFAPANAPWDDIPAFTGVAGWFGGVVNGTVVCSCDGDGGFRIFCTDADITPISGTYAVSGDTYTLTTEDGITYTTVNNAETGVPEFTIPVHRPSLEAHNAADTEAVLSLIVPEVD